MRSLAVALGLSNSLPKVATVPLILTALAALADEDLPDPSALSLTTEDAYTVGGWTVLASQHQQNVPPAGPPVPEPPSVQQLPPQQQNVPPAGPPVTEPPPVQQQQPPVHQQPSPPQYHQPFYQIGK